MNVSSGVTRETHSKSQFVDDRVGNFANHSKELKSSTTTGSTTTKTAHSSFHSVEDGDRKWSRDDSAKVTNVDRGTDKLKVWRETQSVSFTDFSGKYELISTVESNLYANGTTDSYSKSESTDTGTTDSLSGVGVVSKLTDARNAPGYDVDAQEGTSQSFTGTLLEESGDSYTLSTSTGSLWSYGQSVHEKNTAGKSSSLSQTSSKSHDNGASVYDNDCTVIRMPSCAMVKRYPSAACFSYCAPKGEPVRREG